MEIYTLCAGKLDVSPIEIMKLRKIEDIEESLLKLQFFTAEIENKLMEKKV